MALVGREALHERQHLAPPRPGAAPSPPPVGALLQPADQVHHQLRLHALDQGREQLVHDGLGRKINKRKNNVHEQGMAIHHADTQRA